MKNRQTTAVLCTTMMILWATAGQAVTSVIVRHKTGEVLMKGKVDNTVVDSRGIIRLAPRTEKLNLGSELKDVWAIHSILADHTGTLYIGTSPAGKVIRIRDGKTDILYPKAEEKKEPNSISDPNALQQEPQPNEHVFAMAFDVPLVFGCLLMSVRELIIYLYIFIYLYIYIIALPIFIWTR